MRTVVTSLFLFCSFFFQNESFSTTYKFLYANEKVGLTDDKGNILIPAIHDQLGWSDSQQLPVNDLIGFKKGELWGLLNLQNEEVLTNRFTQLYPEGKSFFVASEKGKYSHRDFLGLINASGKQILPFRYSSINITGLKIIVGIKSGAQYNYGLVDLADKVILPIKYKDIQPLGSLRFAVKNFMNYYAIFSDEGNQITSFSIDSIGSYSHGYAVTYSNHKRGIIDIQGKIISPPVYKDIRWNTGLEAHEFNKWEIIDNNKNIQSWQYDLVEPIGDNHFKVIANGRQWIVTIENHEVTSETNSVINEDAIGNYIYKNQQKWGVLRKDSTTILNPIYDSIIHLNKKYLVLKKDHWSLVDAYGIEKTTQNYEEAVSNAGNYLSVKKRGKWGVIDHAGIEVIHCVYEELEPMKFDKMVVKFHGQFGVIDKLGNWIVLPQNGEIKILNDQLFLVNRDGLKTLRSFDKETIYFTTNKIEIKEDHLLEHLQDGGLWKIDFKGRIVRQHATQQKFQEIRSSSEGLFAVKINNRYGFVDNQNRLLIANRYENVGDFSEEFVSMKLLGKWGFIDKKENIVIQPIYEEVSAFTGGVSVVRLGDTYGLIDKMGKKVSNFNYNQILRQPNGKYVVIKDSKYGLLNIDGSLLILPKYDYLEELSNGFIKVSLFGKYGILTGKGVDTLPIIYDDITFDQRFGYYLTMKKSEWENLSN